MWFWILLEFNCTNASLHVNKQIVYFFQVGTLICQKVSWIMYVPFLLAYNRSIKINNKEEFTGKLGRNFVSWVIETR